MRRAQLFMHSPLNNGEQSALCSRLQRALGPGGGSGHGIHDLSFITWMRSAHVQRHHNVAAQALLDVDGTLGREVVLGSIDVTAKHHTVVADLSSIRQAEHLVSAGIGEDVAVPAHHPMEPSQCLDPLVSGAKHEMVRIAQTDGSAQGAQLVWIDTLYGSAGADRHEHGCGNLSVWCRNDTRPGFGFIAGVFQSEGQPFALGCGVVHASNMLSPYE